MTRRVVSMRCLFVGDARAPAWCAALECGHSVQWAHPQERPWPERIACTDCEPQ